MPRSRGKAEGDVYRSMGQSTPDEARLLKERARVSASMRKYSGLSTMMMTVETVIVNGSQCKMMGQDEVSRWVAGAFVWSRRAKILRRRKSPGDVFKLLVLSRPINVAMQEDQMITAGDRNRDWVVILEGTDGAMMCEWNGDTGLTTERDGDCANPSASRELSPIDSLHRRAAHLLSFLRFQRRRRIIRRANHCILPGDQNSSPKLTCQPYHQIEPQLYSFSTT